MMEDIEAGEVEEDIVPDLPAKKPLPSFKDPSKNKGLWFPN